MQNTQKVSNNHLPQSMYLKEAKNKIELIDDAFDKWILTGAISNNYRYIIAGRQDYLLKIWNIKTNVLVKSRKFYNQVMSCKFTEDSKLLYVGIHNRLYQFQVNNKFKQLCKLQIDKVLINNIFCISNTMILTSSNKIIIKTDFVSKQQILKIDAHDGFIYGLDYNNRLNIIASGSNDASIKLWNGKNGNLIIAKLNAHQVNQHIKQVLFIIKKNQLLSLDARRNLVVWNIKYQTNQLQLKEIIENSGYNISLVLEEQFIIITGNRFIKVYTIQWDFVGQLYHEVDHFWAFNTIQPCSMKAILVLGNQKIQVCKLCFKRRE